MDFRSMPDEENGLVVRGSLLAQDNLYLQADMCRIDQVVRNLITNAVRESTKFLGWVVADSLLLLCL